MTKIHPARIRALNPCERIAGDYVLYWMQQSQRARFNHALEYAVNAANEAGEPLVVAFGLTDDYPDANLRHYRFMLEGLRETGEALEERGIGFVLQRGEPADVALKLARHASMVVCDCGYLRHQRLWRSKLAVGARCRVVQVESDVIVPVELASQKAEFAARTLRPKIHRHFDDHLVALKEVRLKKRGADLRLETLLWQDVEGTMASLKLDRSVAPVTRFFKGGTGAAETIFGKFCRRHLHDYAEHRNQPQTEDVSHMSKYLHFGQISPVWLALEASKHRGENNVDVFVEELLVRRELAMNFAHFTDNYDQYDCLPAWARRTLAEHKPDKRPVLYSRQTLEAAGTHDPYWNAAMREMRTTGYMHNHMRMYWGKKILEWSATPEEAFAVALAINNKYFLDGRDANSYANIAWVFGQHDRPWGERPIFGKVRYMNAAGLERKCDIQAYVAKVDRLTGS